MSATSAANGTKRRHRRTVREHGPDPVDIHVGKRLRQARLLAGMSQEELGEGIGVSFQAVQKYEQGENRLSASRLFRAAKLLEQTVSYFFDELAGEGPIDGPPAFTRDEIDLVRHYRQIASEDVREHLLQVAKRISEVEGAADALLSQGSTRG
ncbi:MAG TPA: helix-turn-helix transcriptional regulator [Stellaceae bacterium]|nr:helix-turn-helix transcriptional regulator [Stellaceae bacterium]